MKTSYAISAAFLAAALMTVLWAKRDHPAFEEEVVRAALINEAQGQESRCPLNAETLERTEPWVIATCMAGGLGWHEAALRYGDDAARVFAVYRGEPILFEVFDRYGHAVIPVIAYFVENGSTQYQIQETIGEGLSRLWNDSEISFRIAELSPEQYGLIAIHELRKRGHEMLSEFEIVDGKAKRKQLTRTLLGAKNLIFGGVSELESVIARGERLPRWPEIGWAALDLVVIGGVGVAAKTIRVVKSPAAKAGRTAGRLSTLRATGRGVVESLASVGKIAGAAAIVAVPYVALTRPDLFAAAAGWLSEQVGLPAWIGVFVAYSALCLAVAVLVRILLGPLAWVSYLLYVSMAKLARLARSKAAPV